MPNEILGLENIQQAVRAIPPDPFADIGTLITIFQALGIFFIIYIFFLTINLILNIRRGRKMKKMNKKMDEMNEKLDKLLNKFNKPKKDKNKHKDKK